MIVIALVKSLPHDEKKLYSFLATQNKNHPNEKKMNVVVQTVYPNMVALQQWSDELNEIVTLHTFTKHFFLTAPS